MKKILVVFGTRPEAIKLAPLVHKLRQRDHVQVSVCVTAQHREMLDQALQLFGIVPEFDLDLMRAGQSLTTLAAAVLSDIQAVLTQVQPDIVVVQGDTTTTFSAGLAAFYHGAQVAHVEAGLRSGNLMSPWPEEGNRKMTSQFTSFHFAPTDHARANLLAEGVKTESIHVTGNTVIDALFDTLSRIRADESMRLQFDRELPLNPGNRNVLITAHRRESFGSGIANIVASIKKLSAAFPDYAFIYPVHPNPNVSEPVHQGLADIANVRLIEPLDYAPFVYLMERSHLILTDSGGVQEEAPSLGKPVLVMRDVTERVEAVAAGTVRLVGTNPDSIVSAATRLLTDETEYQRMSSIRNPYGDGHSAEKIAQVLESSQG